MLKCIPSSVERQLIEDKKKGSDSRPFSKLNSLIQYLDTDEFKHLSLQPVLPVHEKDIKERSNVNVTPTNHFAQSDSLSPSQQFKDIRDNTCSESTKEDKECQGSRISYLSALKPTSAFEMIWVICDSIDEMKCLDWIQELLNRAHLECVEIVVVKQSDIDDLFLSKHPNPSVIIISHNTNYETCLHYYGSRDQQFGIIHLGDQNLEDNTDCYNFPSCKFVFRNEGLKPLSSSYKHVFEVPIGYRHDFRNDLIADNSTGTRDYNWSFIGTHSQLSECGLMNHDNFKVNNGIIHSLYEDESELDMEDYRDCLLNSRFAICPVQEGHVDSCVVYEALQCGCIPVVLYNTGLHNKKVPFVMESSWSLCSQTMNKWIQEDCVDTKRKECLSWWNDYKNQLSSTFRQQFKLLSC